MKKKKEQLISTLNEDNFYEIDEPDFDEIEEVGMIDFFKKGDKSMRGVVLPHNFVVLGSSMA